ncbi:hypothetical protein ABPG72_007792 [Tetrahymena utriculariae]
MRLIYIAVMVLYTAILASAGYRKHYQILEIKSNASEQEIKKQYRRLSQKYHPDKNHEAGAQERYQQINQAYEILKDKDLRRVYDQEGDEGVKRYQQQKQQGNQGGGDIFDIFGGFFGNQRRNVERRGPELKMRLYVSLEDIYNGSEVPFFITKQILCPHCRGTGADDPDHIKTCPACNGQGHVIRRQQIAPGYYQQFQQTCDKCGGRGKTVTSRCHVCRGSKTIPGFDEMSVFVEKGIGNGQTIKFDGGGDEYVDVSASDIVFEIAELPHSIFVRRGNNLHISIQITLKEALLGFKKKIKHLDGHYVKISKIGVTQPEEVQQIQGEGMPIHQQSSNFGDLFVRYIVKFERQYNNKQITALEEFFKIPN